MGAKGRTLDKCTAHGSLLSEQVVQLQWLGLTGVGSDVGLNTVSPVLTRVGSGVGLNPLIFELTLC
jgi:hypothetical protein